MNANLSTKQKKLVKNLIRRHANTFAWKSADMPEMDPQIMSHKLNVSPKVKPIKQKKSMYGAEMRKATRSEVEKLIEAKFIREVGYLKWLANLVVIKKSNSKYQMCIDFTNLNQAYSKDY